MSHLCQHDGSDIIYLDISETYHVTESKFDLIIVKFNVDISEN